MITNFKFGITEQGDAGLDLSWEDRLNAVVGAIIISKSDSNELIEALLRNSNKCIYHATCTGLGGSIIEPNVPTYEKKLEHIYNLISRGFPTNQIIIRIDPIFPVSWVNTLNTKLSIDYITILKNILQFAEQYEIKTIRYSYLDLYDHNMTRFINSQLRFNSYGKIGNDEIKLNDLNNNLIYESCAEAVSQYDHKVGCISKNDLKRLGIENKFLFTGSSKQRVLCLCPSQKLELLNHKKQCEHKCMYCYWKD